MAAVVGRSSWRKCKLRAGVFSVLISWHGSICTMVGIVIQVCDVLY